MRHRKGFKHLGVKSPHRKAMLSNLSCSLIMHKRIYTTIARAKELRQYIEPLLTKSKKDTTHSRRSVFSYIEDKNAVSELFRVVAPKISGRPGGYTRILKTGFRAGDSADMCLIEFVDFNENMLAVPKESKVSKPKTRRGRGKKNPQLTSSPTHQITNAPQKSRFIPQKH